MILKWFDHCPTSQQQQQQLLGQLPLSFSHSLSVVLILFSVSAGFTPLWLPQMECDDKEMRREISYAIKNIHGIRYMFVCRCSRPLKKMFLF